MPKYRNGIHYLNCLWYIKMLHRKSVIWQFQLQSLWKNLLPRSISTTPLRTSLTLTYVPVKSMSSHKMNLIVPTTSLYFPLIYFSEKSDGVLIRPYNRYLTIHNSALWDIGDYKYMDFIITTHLDWEPSSSSQISTTMIQACYRDRGRYYNSKYLWYSNLDPSQHYYV